MPELPPSSLGAEHGDLRREVGSPKVTFSWPVLVRLKNMYAPPFEAKGMEYSRVLALISVSRMSVHGSSRVAMVFTRRVDMTKVTFFGNFWQLFTVTGA